MAVPLEPQALVSHIEATLDAVQGSLLEQATAFRDKNTVDVTTYDELKVSWVFCKQNFQGYPIRQFPVGCTVSTRARKLVSFHPPDSTRRIAALVKICHFNIYRLT